MPLQILSSPPPEPEDVVKQLEDAIRAALPGSEVAISARGPGHFEIDVAWAEFEGLTRVKQQQRVYAAIRELMSGSNAPVHAVDRMVTRVP